MKNNLPKSIKRFIRQEKSKIKKAFFDPKEVNSRIDGIYKRFLKNKDKE